jgi:hypothetical protein
MPWYANQIYARPTPDVMAAFAKNSFLADQLYCVDNLRGVRSEWSRELLLSTQPPEDRKHMRHGLPPSGLVVVGPEIYETGYDRRKGNIGQFARHYRQNRPWSDSPPADKWSRVDGSPAVAPLFPEGFDASYYPLGLFRFLKEAFEQTRSPIVYYQCVTLGGEVEEETAWIFDERELVYQHHPDGVVDDMPGDKPLLIEYTPEQKRFLESDQDLLQLAMRPLGLNLPTRFFALHETSFDWKLYRIPAGHLR